MRDEAFEDAFRAALAIEKEIEEEQVEDYSDTWNIEPDDMPSFLNEVASKYFKNNERIRFKLAQCSAYIHGIHYNARKLVCSPEERKPQLRKRSCEAKMKEFIVKLRNGMEVGYGEEIVRCKDCKNYMTIHCTCDGCCISPDWFCADGERGDS